MTDVLILKTTLLSIQPVNVQLINNNIVIYLHTCIVLDLLYALLP